MPSRRSHLGYRGSAAVSFSGFLCHWFIRDGTGAKICVGQGYGPHLTDAKVPSESADEAFHGTTYLYNKNVSALLSFISLRHTFLQS